MHQKLKLLVIADMLVSTLVFFLRCEAGRGGQSGGDACRLGVSASVGPRVLPCYCHTVKALVAALTCGSILNKDLILPGKATWQQTPAESQEEHALQGAQLANHRALLPGTVVGLQLQELGPWALGRICTRVLTSTGKLGD